MALKITQTKSTIGVQKEHHGTLRSLGLGRIGKTTVREDSPALRGQLRQVAYLVQVVETEE